MNCTNCGKPVDLDTGANFCGSCGTPVPPDGVETGQGRPGSGSSRDEVTEAERRRRQAEFEQENLIDRSGFQVNQLFDPSGRNNRLTYLVVQVSIVGAWIVAALVAVALPILYVTWIVLAPLGFWVSLVNNLRRLRDLDNSGWLVLIFLVPFVSFFFLLYLLFAPGKPRPIEGSR